MECRYLWFEDANGKQYQVRKRPVKREEIDELIRKDLAKRRPERVIFYMRYSELEDGGLWIDFGSHTEFYYWR